MTARRSLGQTKSLQCSPPPPPQLSPSLQAPPVQDKGSRRILWQGLAQPLPCPHNFSTPVLWQGAPRVCRSYVWEQTEGTTSCTMVLSNGSRGERPGRSAFDNSQSKGRSASCSTAESWATKHPVATSQARRGHPTAAPGARVPRAGREAPATPPQEKPSFQEKTSSVGQRYGRDSSSVRFKKNKLSLQHGLPAQATLRTCQPRAYRASRAPRPLPGNSFTPLLSPGSSRLHTTLQSPTRGTREAALGVNFCLLGRMPEDV